jgi:hypothetical protein
LTQARVGDILPALWRRLTPPARVLARRGPHVNLTHTERRKIMAENPDDRIRPSVVIARVGTTEKKYQDCKVIFYGDAYADIYTVVFGPASAKECKQWVAKNCDHSPK